MLRYGTQLANRAGIDQALRHYDTYSLLDPAAPDAVAQLLNGCTLLDKSVPPPHRNAHQHTPSHTNPSTRTHTSVLNPLTPAFRVDKTEHNI